MSKIINGRTISKGIVLGEVLMSKDAISFLGGINPKNGMCEELGHCLYGKCISGKILVFPSGKGSTVGSYVMLQLSKNNKAPLAIINVSAEPIIAVGAIISNIAMIDNLEQDPFTFLQDGMQIKVDADNGFIELQ